MNTNGKTTNWQESQAGQKMMSAFSEERTLHAIEKLLHKVDTLEKAVDNLTVMMNQAPGMAAMVTDMADEAIRDANTRGVIVEERLKTALHLAEKLTEPAVAEKIDGVLALADQLPGLAAMTADTADEAMRNLNTQGVNVEERLQSALHIAEKLTAPEMVQKIDGLIEVSNQMPGLVAMGVDVYDEGMKYAKENGFNPEILWEVASNANYALTNAKTEPPAKVGGIFGIFRLLNDKDRQRGLGFLMNFLKHFGKNIKINS